MESIIKSFKLFEIKYYENSTKIFHIERNIRRTKFFFSKKKTIVLDENTYRLRKNYKNERNRAIRAGNQVSEGLTDHVLDSYQYIHETGHAPSALQIKNNTDKYDIKWFYVQDSGQVLSSIGLIIGSEYCWVKYISSKGNQSAKNASVFMVDEIFKKLCLEKGFKLDLGGISYKGSNGIDRFKRGFGGVEIYHFENYSFILGPVMLIINALKYVLMRLGNK